MAIQYGNHEIEGLLYKYQVVKVSPGGSLPLTPLAPLAPSLPLTPNGQCRVEVCYTMFWGPHHLWGQGARGSKGSEREQGEQERSERGKEGVRRAR